MVTHDQSLLDNFDRVIDFETFLQTDDLGSIHVEVIMKGILFLAWRYVCFHKTKTLILIACIFLTAILPIAIRILLSNFQQSLVQRADATPAMIGAKGSSLDLVLHGLHFDRSPGPDASLHGSQTDPSNRDSPIPCRSTPHSKPPRSPSLVPA